MRSMQNHKSGISAARLRDQEIVTGFCTTLSMSDTHTQTMTFHQLVQSTAFIVSHFVIFFGPKLNQ